MIAIIGAGVSGLAAARDRIERWTGPSPADATPRRCFSARAVGREA
ncbi:MAG TPA: hypothetical protein VHM67_16495 [Gemmatimonadaceae bacterium]|nr:hypothetical protein [Gemmatimonadaceae bacterium]